MIKIAAILVNLVPYVLAVIVSIIGVHNHNRKKRGDIDWIFLPLVLVGPFPLVTESYLIVARVNHIQENILSLSILLIAYLMLDAALYIAMQPSEYNENFYIAWVPSGLGLIISSLRVLVFLL
ncbi:MAG: hypothetical protein ACI4JS_06220 [Oscillospiraceae bacterium]